MVKKEYYEDRYAEEAAGEEEVLSRPAWAREMPYWTVSAALHIFLVLIIGGLIFSRRYRGLGLLRHILFLLS